MLHLTSEKYWESVKETYVGKQLGNKVIIMGTSAGGSNAYNWRVFPEISSIILLSPNIAINDRMHGSPTIHRVCKFKTRKEI
jgi:alpha-beta hydrolase superfamily lysophospholipase